jgi:prophage tail gpP-like protein
MNNDETKQTKADEFRRRFIISEAAMREAAAERQRDRELAHRVLDAGYRAMRKELHPKLTVDQKTIKMLKRIRAKLKNAFA